MANSKIVIESMLSDIKAHKRDRQHLMEFYVELRLNKQIDVYYKQLIGSVETLSHMSEKRVVKHLNKD